MKTIRQISLLLSIILLVSGMLKGQPILIQENDTGFCSIDGTVMTSVEGYTGSGYADTDRGIGKSVSWSIQAPTAETCWMKWRYANGGGSGDRLADLLLNLEVAVEDVNFVHTGDWTNWTISDSVSVELSAGYNGIRLVSKSEDGLANIDYIEMSGPGIEPVECVPVYTMEIGQNIPEGGTISVEPDLTYYDEGTEVILRAHANPGFFFQSWSGNISSTDTAFTFFVSGNVQTRAMFYPEGTTMDPGIIGYATVQDDHGTPFLLIGGSLGSTVEVNSLAQLQTYLQSDEPYVVTVSKKIEGTGEVQIKSDKTLLGITDSAYIRGIMLVVNGAQNVIIKNMKLSHVVRWDEIEITGSSRNVWIDHCNLFTDRDHDIDYYDGLLDIKNESRFITVSWCRLHDHKKCSLISSGDGSIADTVIRITCHHNFFYNCGSRLPSIRFGKAHIFNNYYLNSDDAISTRMGACVRVENNYFENVGKAVFNDQSPEVGYVHLLENHFGSASYVTEPTCILNVPYIYESVLDATEDIPAIVGDTTVPVAFSGMAVSGNSMTVYPNPADHEINLLLKTTGEGIVNITLRDISGRIIKTFPVQKITRKMQPLKIHVDDLYPGPYFLEVTTQYSQQIGKIVILR
jgi:pectate lyase